MMMVTSYADQDYKEGTYFQVAAFLLFLSLKVYTGFTDGNWHYLLADPVYALAAIKNYKKDVQKKDLKFINGTSMSVLSLLIICVILIPFRMKFEVELIRSMAEWIQTGGIFLFAIA